MLTCIEAAVTNGVNIVQVRSKKYSELNITLMAQRIIKLVHGRALIIVNRSVSSATQAGADGVHASEKDPIDIKRAHRLNLISGKSVHSVEKAIIAESEGYDYLIAGTIFSSPSHPGGEIGGIELISEICSRVSLPVIAIGGIKSTDVSNLFERGAAGIAVISGIVGQPEPSQATLKFTKQFQTIGAWS